MKIGIDARMIGHSGIGTRIRGILNALKNHDDHEFYLFGCHEKLKEFLVVPQFRFVEYSAPVYSIRELLGHPKMKEMDILDIPHFNIPLPYIRKSVVTIHDIIPYRMREFHSSIPKRIYFALVMFFICRHARHVVTVSDYTGKDLQEALGFDSRNMTTVYNAVDHELFHEYPVKAVKDFKKKYNLPEKYFLTVGIGKGHKNLNFLLDQLERYDGKNKFPLVIAGTDGKLPDYARPDSRDMANIILVPKLSWEELALLYQGAFMFLFPSLYEGFGFPCIEAQACGTPVLSSNATVMSEVLWSSAAFFDPYDNESFQEVLGRVAGSAAERRTLVKKGLENIKRFTWEKTVLGMQEVYGRHGDTGLARK